MDSFKTQDLKAEKAYASRYRKIQRLVTLFRFMELFVFLFIISSSSTQFVFPFKISTEYLKGISISLISPQFVFVLGNTIVIVLFLISHNFSTKNDGKNPNFYDEYVEKCTEKYKQQECSKEKQEICKYRNNVGIDKQNKIIKSRSQNFGTVNVHEPQRELRRSVTENCRKVVVSGSTRVEESMSSEEFRSTVEAFIARQQKFLREEEGFTAAVFSA